MRVPGIEDLPQRPRGGIHLHTRACPCKCSAYAICALWPTLVSVCEQCVCLLMITCVYGVLTCMCISTQLWMCACMCGVCIPNTHYAPPHGHVCSAVGSIWVCDGWGLVPSQVPSLQRVSAAAHFLATYCHPTLPRGFGSVPFPGKCGSTCPGHRGEARGLVSSAPQ